MNDFQLYVQISSLPDNLKEEVSNFVAFLKQKAQSKPRLNERKLGVAKGLITMSSDFDEPLEDFKEYM